MFVVVFFGALMMSLELTLADEVKCEFNNISLSFLHHAYGCEIKSITQNRKGQNLIKGLHNERKNDIDVKGVKYIGYTASKIKLAAFDSSFCEKFPNLKEIALYGLVPASIDQSALQNCNKLVNFTLKGAEILKVPEKFFPATLQKLVLSNNKLTTLPESFLKDSHQLEWLDLSENQINSLKPNIFKSLTDLQNLYLDENNLHALDPAWFESLQNLKRLYLNKNKISELPRGVFASLKNLKRLWLDNNHLTVIHADSFGIHNKLDMFYLYNNELNAIEEKFLDILIASPAFGTGRDGGINARSNECVDDWVINKSELKQRFARCTKNFQPRPQLPTRIQLQSCGISKTIQGDIVGGTYITPNSFPWHAALLKEGNYRCGGTLVTEQKIVTAAHCIQPKGESKAVLPRELHVLLGAHNLSNYYEPSRRNAAIRYIHMHDNWNPNDRYYDFDIAVIVLSDPVPFDKYVQPICQIPVQNSTFFRNSITSGYVVGYGYSEDAYPHETVPRMISMPITSYTECIKTFPLLGGSATRRTFCGGRADGSGVCKGDSGGGLIVEYNQRYFLRGIVSSSLKGGPQWCGEHAYSVLTDILFYTKWIDEIEVD